MRKGRAANANDSAIDNNGNTITGGVLRNEESFACYGRTASKKSFDELAAEKGIKTFRK